MPEKNDPGTGSDPGKDPGTSQGAQEIKVMVGDEERVLSVADVKGLVEQEATMTQKLQKIAPIMEAAKKYGVDPDVFVQQAEGSFGIFGSLLDAGVIDENGNHIEKKSEMAPTAQIPPLGTSAVQPIQPAGQTKFEETVTKALTDIGTRQGRLEETQSELMKMDIERELKRKHPGLQDEDVMRLFARSKVQKQKSIWEHAEDLVKVSVGRNEDLRAKHAKEFGIDDLEEWDSRNKLKEQGAEGGASAFLEGKKPSFFKGKGKTSPGKMLGALLRSRGV